MIIKERLKFYADTPRGEKNKRFTWSVSVLNLEDAIFRFMARGYYIRAAWYEMINPMTGETTNEKIKVQELFDKFCTLSAKERDHYIKVQIKDSYSTRTGDHPA